MFEEENVMNENAHVSCKFQYETDKRLVKSIALQKEVYL